MKRILIFMILVIGTCFMGCDNNFDSENDDVVATIAIIGDVHIGKKNTKPSPEDKLAKALDELRNIAPKLDAIAFAGDMVDLGTDSEYEEFVRIVEAHTDSSVPKIYAMGNHEYFRDGVVRYGGESSAFIEECQKAYKEYLSPELDTVSVVNGVYIIAISARNSAASYAECEDFIIESVEKAASKNPNMPIVIISHEGAGSFFEGGVSGYTQKTIETLNKYPQIIFFSGHTHLALQDMRMIQQDKYTTVQTSTVGADFWNYTFESVSQPENAESASQGLILQVKKDGTSEIIRYDFTNSVSIGEPWKVDPKNFTHIISQNRKLAKNPVFPENAAITVTKEGRRVVISFPKATLDDEVSEGIVYKYRIRVTDKLANKIVHNGSFVADYHMGVKAADSYTYKINGLAQSREFTAEVIAVSIYDKQSQSLNVDFMTD